MAKYTIKKKKRAKTKEVDEQMYKAQTTWTGIGARDYGEKAAKTIKKTRKR